MKSKKKTTVKEEIPEERKEELKIENGCKERFLGCKEKNRKKKKKKNEIGLLTWSKPNQSTGPN